MLSLGVKYYMHELIYSVNHYEWDSKLRYASYDADDVRAHSFIITP